MPTDLVSTCGQLIVGGYLDVCPSPTFLAALKRGHRAGAILFRRNLPSTEAAYDACRTLISTPPQELPALIGIDQEGGRVQRLRAPLLELPPMGALASRADADWVQELAQELGAQLRALGFSMNFAPVLDVNTNPANPVIGDRSFGNDATAVAHYGVAMMRGLQAAGIGACGKHFPGHGDTSVDSHLALPCVDTTIASMHQVELVPFRAAIQAGIDSLMTAHIVCRAVDDQVPATLCAAIVSGLLRDELGFEGLVFSDDLEMKAIAGRGSIAGAAVEAIRAGCDVVLICKEEAPQEQALEFLVREAERDSSFRTRCEQAAARSLALRRKRRSSQAARYGDALARMQSKHARELTARLAAWQEPALTLVAGSDPP